MATEQGYNESSETRGKAGIKKTNQNQSQGAHLIGSQNFKRNGSISSVGSSS